MKRLSPMLLIGAMLLGSSAAARDIFVDNRAGDDRFDGKTTQSLADGTGPVRTIGRALQLAQPGDRIVLAPNDEPYRESVTLAGNRHGEYPGQPLTISGNGAVLDGSKRVPEEAWEHHAGAVFRFRPPRAAHGNLFLDDRPLPRVVPELRGDGLPQLEPKQWCLHGGWIYFCVESTKLPEDYGLTYAHHRVGITLHHVRGVAITDLIVQGYQLDGIGAANSARKVLLSGITARGNGRAGVSIGGASAVELSGCLLGNNGEAQLLTLPYSFTEINDSTLLGNTAPGWVDQGGRVMIDGEPADNGRDQINAEAPAD